MSSQFTFNAVPQIHLPRSKFPMKFSLKTAFNEGQLIPIYCQEVYPGDTFKLKDTFVIRTSVPFVRPIMDNLMLDTYYFFVPNRLVFEAWESLMGDNKESAWKNTQIFTTPQATGNVSIGSLADYFGLPIYNYETNSDYFNELPFRAYALIVNDWFRNENYQDPVFINKASGLNKNGKFNSNAWAPNNILGLPANINKLKDYFTSVLPEPQKADAVNLQFGLGVDAPVISKSKLNPLITNASRLSFFNLTDGEDFGASGFAGFSSGKFGVDDDTSFNVLDELTPANLFADLSGLNIANVNDLRYAFALQRMYEKDAIYGTRYIETLEGHFGVSSPDARLQRPEFLGGHRTPIQLSQVAQTVATGEGLGQVGAYSLTNGKAGFSKAFLEHGFIIGLAAVRQIHTYQQGFERFWTRRYRSDYYDPSFAMIGYQPVYKREIFAQEALESDVWGYNQAWNDLRFRPNAITGALRSDAENGLDIWHLGDEYASSPTMGGEFLQETPSFLDRTLSAGSQTIPNFILDVYHDSVAVRRLPVYSTPGLIDHF